MLAKINPKPLSGTVPAISSKSMAHRIIIAAALANGVTRVACDTTCADIDATIRCLTAIGAKIDPIEGGCEIHTVLKSLEHGILRALAGATLDCGESGSTLSLMIPVACALGADATFVGSPRRGERPIAPLTDELMAAGCTFQGAAGLLLRTSGRMRAGRFELPGNESSQYISGLLLAAPLLDGDTQIAVTGEIESRPYIGLTLAVLNAFGVKVGIEEGATPGGLPLTVFAIERQGYRTPGVIAVEGDWSNAAFWLSAGALGRHSVTVRGVTPSSIQGDRRPQRVRREGRHRGGRDAGRPAAHRFCHRAPGVSHPRRHSRRGRLVQRRVLAERRRAGPPLRDRPRRDPILNPGRSRHQRRDHAVRRQVAAQRTSRDGSTVQHPRYRARRKRHPS